MKVRYVIEIEVDEMKRADLQVVGMTLASQAVSGVSKAHTNDVVEIDV